MTMREKIPVVVELWNSGMTLRQIAARIGYSESYVGHLLWLARCDGIVTRIKINTPQPPVNVTCNRCGKAFVVRRCLYAQGYGKYCSRRCAGEYPETERERVIALYLQRKTTRGVGRDAGIPPWTVRIWIKYAIEAGEVPDYRPRNSKPIPAPAAGYLPATPLHATSPAPALTKRPTAPGAFSHVEPHPLSSPKP